MKKKILNYSLKPEIHKDLVFFSFIPKSPHTLDGPISEAEIKSVISKLRDNSSPGPDGFVPKFYKLFSDKLVPYLTKLYNSILLNKQPPPKDFKVALVRFIAKKGSDLTHPKGWRPISLLNFDSKILSGVLALRLQSVLPSMTSNTAYIPNRLILENVLNLEAFFKLNLGGNFAFMSDFNNAFDTLNHKWIIHVIENAGLGQFFLNAVKFLLQDMKAFPIIESSPTKHSFNLQAGVRQGDPLSGLLFVLCIEPLIRAANAISVKALALC